MLYIKITYFLKYINGVMQSFMQSFVISINLGAPLVDEVRTGMAVVKG